MNDHWIEGRFEGVYEGQRVVGASERGGPRRFSFRVRSGEVRDAALVLGPFPEAPDVPVPREIRQGRVGGIRLAVPQLDLDRRDTSLFDVRIVDWRLSRPAESKGRSHGRIEGTIRARLLPPSPAPLPDAQVIDDSQVAAKGSSAPMEGGPSMIAPTGRKRRSEATKRSRSIEVEGLDAATVYARLRWFAALVVALVVAGALWSSCGGRLAATWLGVVAAAMALRGMARSAIRAGTTSQALLAGTLVVAQGLLFLEPLARGGSIGCMMPTPVRLAGLGVAVMAASLLRGRSALVVTSLVWTACIGAWCAALGGECMASAAAPDTVRASEPTEHRPAPRTSPDGHWPVMPGGRAGAGAGGGAAWAPGMGGVEGAPGGAGQASFAGGDDGGLVGGGPGSGGAGGAGGSSGAGARMDMRAAQSGGATDAAVPSRGGPGIGARAGEAAAWEQAEAASSAQGTTSGAPSPTRPERHGGRGASTRGGWVTPDAQRASAGAELISIEHANRSPDAFFGEGGGRRVYVPTDAIFEPGGADIRATGALQLGRIAALLALHPERRTVLVVHTDAGAGLEARQRLSERRATSVRGWLVDRGHVEADQFEVVGAGGAHPLVPPDGSYAAQQPNRRIEISVVE